MEIIEAVKARKSIRGFKPDPVPQAVMAEILSISLRTPSPVNVQPWEITVLTGAPLEEWRRAAVANLEAGVWPNSWLSSEPFAGVYRQRQMEIGKQLFQLMGIGREDKDARAEWEKRGCRGFDAPAAIFVSVDDTLDIRLAQSCVGSLTQTIALVALEYELGTCIAEQMVFYPEEIKRIAGIPASKRVITGMAIGYPDWNFPANKVQSRREELANVVTWCGYK